IDGERSGIYVHVIEAVRVLRPRLVFLENVAAIRSRGLWQVVADLAAIGYDLRWTCLRASEVGAPHHRDRWFGVAYPADTDGAGLAFGSVESPREELPSSERGDSPPEDSDRAAWAERSSTAPGEAQEGGAWSHSR